MSRAPGQAVLGIWDGHDASVALIADGRLTFALSEERISRRKRHPGFPHLALGKALRWAERQGLTIGDVAVAGRHGRAPLRLLEPAYSRSGPSRDPLAPAGRLVQAWENRVAGLAGLRELERIAGLLAVRGRLAGQVLGRARVHTVPHHEAHAFSALLLASSPDDRVVTWDAYGEGLAATVRRAGSPRRVEAALAPAAGLASLYGAITVALGFDEGDEGKLMALAALGDPSRGEARLAGLFVLTAGAPLLRRPLRHRTVHTLLQGLSREDAAAALQALVERLARGWIAGLLPREGRCDLLLAGGLFANTRLNQALAALDRVGGVRVFPAMTDGGLSAGAAHSVWHELHGEPAASPGLPLLGCEFDRESCERALAAAGLGHGRAADPARGMARRIAAGQVVCRFSGRDEFGPRALGQRSILFSARDRALAQRVNAALGRDAFMPFGPAVAAEAAEAPLWEPLPENTDLGTMTVAVQAAPALSEQCPAAVHADGSSRPQEVSAAEAPGFHSVLRWVEHLGHGPALINTSFNRHGEPIVHTPADAIQTFLDTGFDALYLGDLEVARNDALA